MEQLTWPRGSGGHIFSTISASDFGEEDRQHRRNDSAHRQHCCNQVFEPSLHRKSSRDRRSSENHHHHHHHHHNRCLQVDLEEQASASGYGVDQLTGRAQNSSYCSIRKDNMQDLDEQGFAYGLDHLTGRAEMRKERAFDYKVEQVTGKSQNSLSFSSRKEREQEASASSAQIDTDINKTKLSVFAVPCASQSELLPSVDNIPHPYLNFRCHSLGINPAHTNPYGRHHSYGPVSNPNSNSKKVYFNINLNHNYGIPHAGNPCPNFAMLPDDILLRITGSFSWPNLWSASQVCRSWCQALVPLREAMHFVHWGKRFKHGRAGVARNLDKALHSFLNGAKRGCAAAMVDVGLLLWEMGQKQEGVYWYKQAAELGDPAGQCNLGLAYLQDPSNPAEAVKWFQRAALAGHVRAQYSLALCLQQGKGVDCSAVKAARWYQRAAEGGSARAMYNLALCYRKGEGLIGDSHEARKWMKRAALAGHRKAQFEHGLTLFAENDGGLALVFLELATRAGETAATHLRDALIQQLSPKLRTHAITRADQWQAKLNARS